MKKLILSDSSGNGPLVLYSHVVKIELLNLYSHVVKIELLNYTTVVIDEDIIDYFRMMYLDLSKRISEILHETRSNS